MQLIHRHVVLLSYVVCGYKFVDTPVIIFSVQVKLMWGLQVGFICRYGKVLHKKRSQKSSAKNDGFEIDSVCSDMS